MISYRISSINLHPINYESDCFNMNFRDFFAFSSWWGKLLGAFFGYLISGPLGALFGLLVGNFFDKGLSSYYSNAHWFYHSEKRKFVQQTFFNSTFSVMGYIAKADGRVSEKEIEMAKLLMNEMRLSITQKEEAKRLYNEGKNPHFQFEKILSLLQATCKDNRDLLKLFVDIQYRAAQVDGLTTKKITALDVVFSFLGFAPLHKQHRFYDDFGDDTASDTSRRQSAQQESASSGYKRYSSSQRQNQNQYQSSYKPKAAPNLLDHAYALLEVNANASKQEVKRAYRKLLSRNHPDKLIAQGLPEEMIKIANDKTHRLMKAYELICQLKGW